MSMTNGESERDILAHYGLNSLYPSEWPAEKEEGDGQESEPESKAKIKHARRFTTLEHSRGKRKGKSPSKRREQDLPPPLPRDEADPLGGSASIVSLLRRKGIPADRDEELKNRYMLSSPQFSPGDYLSQVHNNTPNEELTQGLNVLSASIDEKSASLKRLVEANFERYVRAKATIDNVYTEMLNHGSDGRPSSRHASWQNSLRTRQMGSFKAQPDNEKRKNALIAESQYGTAGVTIPLKEATHKAQEVWGPALGGRDREERLKVVLASIESNKAIFETGAAIEDCIKRREYDNLTEEYQRAQRYRKDAQNIAARFKEQDVNVEDQQIHVLLITGRVLMDIEKRIEDFKRDTWRRLTTAHFTSAAETPDGRQEEYMELIGVLMQLSVDENPIWVWLQSRHDYLRKRIQNSFDHVRVDLELQRRKLLLTSRASNAVLAEHLKTAGDVRRMESSEVDTRPVVTFWERQTSALNTLLSAKGGLLGEIIEFWDTAQGFIDGMRQRSLPAGPEGRSKKFHRLDRENVNELKGFALELFGLVREQLHHMFIDAPVQDISTLVSPTAETPKTPGSAVMTPLKKSRFTMIAEDMPPLPTQSQANAAWENCAFWPPNSNSLSASTYLSRLNNLIGIAAAELASVPLVKNESTLIQQLRSLVGDVRERSINAICAAWIYDSEHCRELEDWSRSSEKQDLTALPSRFSAFETAVLGNLQKIVYVPEAANHSGSPDVVLPPPAKHIDAVQKGFRNTLYKAFGGMMEHAARPANGANSEGEENEEEDLTVPLQREQTTGSVGETIDIANANARKLLTVSNFQTLRSETVPSLLSTFESHFLLTISDDAKTTRDVLSQMHARVFQAYVRPTVDSLRDLVTAGITDPGYAPDAHRPADAKAYVYDTLLTLTHVHTEVSRTTPALTNQVLSYLLEQLSNALIDAFKQRRRYSLSALMQATLDVEFLAQTLDNYTTKKAGEVQGEIYQALDERTDNEARMKLQSGLPEMKSILKRLRERTKGEFGCFKRVRKSRTREGEEGR
ncbi:MAG: hypothetical protein Q9162_005756 [Coniocarpon cinnabarinum]